MVSDGTFVIYHILWLIHFELSRDHTVRIYDRQNVAVTISISALSMVSQISDYPSGSVAFILVHTFSSWHSVVRREIHSTYAFSNMLFFP